MKFSIGADPEFILLNEEENPKSAIGILKDKNFKNKVYYDNVLAEVNVVPSFEKHNFVKNIKKSLHDLSRIVDPLKISNESFCEFPISELNNKDAFEFGCDSEYCAYELERIKSEEIEKIFKERNSRFAGGHIHIGCELKDQEAQIMLVRMLDLFLGNSLILIDDTKNCIQRRFYFGKFGRYRKTNYGIEYRTPSNFWTLKEKTISIVYEVVDFVINFSKEKKYFNFWKIDHENLNSDDFWNNGGDPSKCYDCFGYDVNNLRKIYTKDQLESQKEILKIIETYMPKDTFKKIKKLENKIT